ncbi:MAG: 16S rRNA processing protein RimM [Slackia sp.]|nr:16S rRNA processing protein RimM [Slackia sp.]
MRSVQHLGSGEYSVEFDKVRDRDTAELLTGSHCLVSYADLPENFDEILHTNAEYLDGFLVVDSVLGEIGHIIDVRAMPTQDLLIVEGASGEIMIPLVDDFIVEFDDDEHILTMDLPCGLIDIDSATSDSDEDDV